MSENQSADGRARTLVVVADDEPAIRLIVARVLVELGLVPVLVSDGAAAIAAVEAHQSELACAILDIVMPGGNGVDAAHVIQMIAPNVPLMLMSGAIPASCAGRITHLRLVGILPKPFSLAALRTLIRQAIADNDTPGTLTEIRDAQSHSVVQDV
jgi:CheY-like chemotaxis protein